jgi:hypothetical protein
VHGFARGNHRPDGNAKTAGRCGLSSGLLDADSVRKSTTLTSASPLHPTSRDIATAGTIARDFESVWFTPEAFFNYRVIYSNLNLENIIKKIESPYFPCIRKSQKTFEIRQQYIQIRQNAETEIRTVCFGNDSPM